MAGRPCWTQHGGCRDDVMSSDHWSLAEAIVQGRMMMSLQTTVRRSDSERLTRGGGHLHTEQIRNSLVIQSTGLKLCSLFEHSLYQLAR